MKLQKKYLTEVLLLKTAYTICIILQTYCYLSSRPHEDSEFVQYNVEVMGRMRLVPEPRPPSKYKDIQV